MMEWCLTMRAVPLFHLKRLSKDDAWSLFSRNAFEAGNSIVDTRHEQIGRKIVEKCQGLPLAIKALGGLLRSKHRVSEWEEVLKSNFWVQPRNDNNVIPALMLSYYHLPPHLKRCFSYCALFPKDSEINSKKLVRLWMAEDFISTGNNRRIEYVGAEYLRQLLSRSFLEPHPWYKYNSCVKMHDLMHDLAQVVSGYFLSRHEIDSSSAISSRARHFSYVVDEFDAITKFQVIHVVKYLRTFLQLPNVNNDLYKYLSNRVSDVLLLPLCCLRVLCLSRYENLVIPDSIGSLKQLRYLDVSGTRIKKLPESVSTLVNLQTLLLSKCYKLRRLPTDLWRLVSLRHLDMIGSWDNFAVRDA